MSVVQLSEILLRFDRGKVLDGLCLSAEVGEYVVILGASGCGKTSLLRLIAGLLRPDAGTIFLSGRDVTGVSPRKRDIAFVPQQAGLYPHLPIGKSIAMGIRDRLGAADAELRVKDAARRVDLESLLDRRPDQLSGGQLRRAAVAKAIARRAALRLLDEPLSAIDANLRFQMEADLRRLHQQTPGATLHVTHDGAEALRLADRVAVVDGGRIAQIDTPEKLTAEPATPAVAAALGQSKFITVGLCRDQRGWSDASGRQIDGPSRPVNSKAQIGFYQDDVREFGATAPRPGDWADDTQNVLVLREHLHWFLD